jgi:hypothetical protein
MLQADDGRFAEFEHAMIPGAFASKMLSPRFHLCRRTGIRRTTPVIDLLKFTPNGANQSQTLGRAASFTAPDAR